MLRLYSFPPLISLSPTIQYSGIILCHDCCYNCFFVHGVPLYIHAIYAVTLKLLIADVLSFRIFMYAYQ